MAGLNTKDTHVRARTKSLYGAVDQVHAKAMATRCPRAHRLGTPEKILKSDSTTLQEMIVCPFSEVLELKA